MSAAEALASKQSVDEVRESLTVTEKGQPANTIGNCQTVFCHDPLLRGAIRLNLLTDRVDIVRDLGWRRNTSALTDTDVKYLLLYFEQNYGLTSEKKMTAALSIVANENCYHPIQDVLNGLVWDGTPRIRSCLHHFLGAEVSDYVEEMLKHFLLGAIRRVFRPGSKYEEMLCLVGGQGAGVPAPAQIPHDVHPDSQEVQPDGVPQERVMAEHRPAVADGVGGLAFFRDGKAFPHLVNALLRR